MKIISIIGISFVIFKLVHAQSAACRPEDGNYKCPMGSKRSCIKRHLLQYDNYNHCAREVDNTWNASVTCNKEEFQCRATHRCVPRHMVNTLDGCNGQSNENIIFQCRDDEFTCNVSKKCIPRNKVRDGKFDCFSFYSRTTLNVLDESDEDKPLSCSKKEFRCHKTGRCIPREWVMNGISDCSFYSLPPSDESTTLTACHETEFFCTGNNRCLQRYRVNDGYKDCKDGKDESMTLSCHLETEFKCLNGRCIPRSWTNDGTENCLQGEDEGVTLSCTTFEFTCSFTKRCLDTKYLCDGIDHCGDCSDELPGICKEYNRTPSMSTCPLDSTSCILNSYMCDSFKDCPSYSENSLLQRGFKCSNRGLTITCSVPQSTLNDNIAICQDKSDLCEKDTCTTCLNGDLVITKNQICDGVVDCPDLSDECICVNKNSKTKELCDQVCYHEGDLKCMKPNIICNHKNDSLVNAGLDEKYCGDETSDGSSKKEKYFDFKCRTDYLDSYKKLVDTLTIKVDLGLLPLDAIKCDGIFECGMMEDECEAECDPLPIACGKFKFRTIDIPAYLLNGKSQPIDIMVCDCPGCYENYKMLLGKSICDGVLECPTYSRFSDETKCADQFFCDGGNVHRYIEEKKIISVHKSKRCDLSIDCSVDQKDERNCSSETHFYCKNGSPLFVPANQKEDGRPDCDDGSDECPEDGFENNPFSSTTEMISNPVLVTLLWLMAIVGIAGNLFVIFTTGKSLYFNKSSNRVLTINRVLLFNLASSDILMGFALLTIAIKAAYFSGRYCVEERQWRASSTCSFVGILIMVSSETSVCLLVLLTAIRLYSVVKPIQSKNLKVGRSTLKVMLIWFSTITLACIPLIRKLGDAMITSMFVDPSPYFKMSEVPISYLTNFTDRLLSLSRSNLSFEEADGQNSWEKSMNLLGQDEFKTYAPVKRGYIGYYSAHGVCMPRLYRTDTNEPINPLTAAVMSFNFVSMIFMIIAYVILYMKSTESGVITNTESMKAENKLLQRKLTVLVMTDVVCWFPVCIISLISISAIPISNMLYAISAIVLLPINSSLNPVIYSNVGVKLWRWIQKLKKNKTKGNSSGVNRAYMETRA